MDTGSKSLSSIALLTLLSVSICSSAFAAAGRGRRQPRPARRREHPQMHKLEVTRQNLAPWVNQYAENIANNLYFHKVPFSYRTINSAFSVFTHKTLEQYFNIRSVDDEEEIINIFVDKLVFSGDQSLLPIDGPRVANIVEDLRDHHKTDVDENTFVGVAKKLRLPQDFLNRLEGMDPIKMFVLLGLINLDLSALAAHHPRADVRHPSAAHHPRAGHHQRAVVHHPRAVPAHARAAVHHSRAVANALDVMRAVQVKKFRDQDERVANEVWRILREETRNYVRQYCINPEAMTFEDFHRMNNQLEHDLLVAHKMSRDLQPFAQQLFGHLMQTSQDEWTRSARNDFLRWLGDFGDGGAQAAAAPRHARNVANALEVMRAVGNMY